MKRTDAEEATQIASAVRHHLLAKSQKKSGPKSSRLELALDDLYAEEKKAYLKLCASLLPKPADPRGKKEGGVTLRDLVRVLEAGPEQEDQPSPPGRRCPRPPAALRDVPETETPAAPPAPSQDLGESESETGDTAGAGGEAGEEAEPPANEIQLEDASYKATLTFDEHNHPTISNESGDPRWPAAIGSTVGLGKSEEGGQR